MPKAFSDEERPRIRTRLIEAGRKLAARYDIKGLTVELVAREAGISKGAFYLFFPSREDFVLSLLESWEDEMRGALFASLLEAEGGAKARLETFFLGALDLLAREPALARLAAGDVEALAARLPEERIAAHRARDGAALDRGLSLLKERGVVGDIGPEAFEGLMMSLFYLALHRADYPKAAFEAGSRVLAEALAGRLAPSDEPAAEAGPTAGGGRP